MNMKTQRGFGLNGVLIVILILLAVGTAGVYVVRNGDFVAEDANNVEENIVVEDEIADLSAEVSATDDWKTYTFDDASRDYITPFSVKYPLNGSVKETLLGTEILEFNTDEETTCALIILAPGRGFGEGVVIERFIDEIILGGEKWSRAIFKFKDNVSSYAYYGFMNEADISFSIDNFDTLDKCLPTYKTILSTFKFIE